MDNGSTVSGMGSSVAAESKPSSFAPSAVGLGVTIGLFVGSGTPVGDTVTIGSSVSELFDRLLEVIGFVHAKTDNSIKVVSVTTNSFFMLSLSSRNSQDGCAAPQIFGWIHVSKAR